MITAVDTSVLLDVFLADPEFGPASLKALERASREGALVASDVVWAEVCAAFEDDAAAGASLSTIGLSYLPLSAQAASLAGSRWRLYRSRGENRKRVIADFLIGAHALDTADGLLTRDRNFQREYFGELNVVEP